MKIMTLMSRLFASTIRLVTATTFGGAALFLVGCSAGTSGRPSLSPRQTAVSPPASSANLTSVAAPESAAVPPIVEQPPQAASNDEPSTKESWRDCQKLAESVCLAVGFESLSCKHITASIEFFPGKACALAQLRLADALYRRARSGPPCETLVSRLCTDLGSDKTTCAMVGLRAASLTRKRCQEMLGEYPTVLAAVRDSAAGNLPLPKEQWAQITESDGQSKGLAAAPVVFVMFVDYRCPFCAKALEAIEQTTWQNSSQVRIVFRHFPSPLHDDAMNAARAAEAASLQGKFWEYQELVLAEPDRLSQDRLLEYAKHLKLDISRFITDLKSEQTRRRVERDIAMGNALHVRGTPWVYLNGQRVWNPTDADAMQDLVTRTIIRLQPYVPTKPKRLPNGKFDM